MRARLLGLVTVVVSLAATPVGGQDFESTEIADGVYQFRWIGHNGMFMTTSQGVVAFDPINMDAAKAFASEIKRIAPGSPLAAIVYSHADADHATGAGVLMEEMGQVDVPIYAHRNAVAPIRARATADQPEPSITFADQMSFEVGGRWIELHYLGGSHTDHIAVPYLPDVGVAFAVDFVASDRAGYQDLASWIFPDFFGAVSGLLNIPFHTIVFGHGPAGDRATIRRQIAYYDDLTAAVRAAIAEGQSEDEAAASIRLPAYASWDRYDDWFSLNVRGVYRWVASGAH